MCSFVEIYGNFFSLSKIYIITFIRKERFLAGKSKLVWETTLRCRHICQIDAWFRSHKLSPFPFFIYLVIFIPVYNFIKRYYEYFRWVFVEFYSFNFVNMRHIELPSAHLSPSSKNKKNLPQKISYISGNGTF